MVDSDYEQKLESELRIIHRASVGNFLAGLHWKRQRAASSLMR
jgi:hypothetical protein